MPATPAEPALPAPLRDALAWLAAQRAAMEDLLRALVEVSSATGDPEGVAGVVAALEPALAAAGVETERVASARFGPHLAFRGPAQGAPVLLVGHADTVFPRGTFEGFRREGERAFGPGAFDMKGGLVVLRFGLAAAARAGLLDRLPVAGLVVSDEEVGSPESQPLLRERARGAACALVFESGRPGDLVVTRRKGVASLRAEARGVAAHAGNEPERGRSAIWALARFVDRVQALSDPARGRSVNVGTFHGGTSKNTVPEGATCDVDLRFETVADGRALEDAVRDAASAAALPGTTIELRAARRARRSSARPRRPRSRPSTGRASARAASAPARPRSPGAAPTRAPRRRPASPRSTGSDRAARATTRAARSWSSRRSSPRRRRCCASSPAARGDGRASGHRARAPASPGPERPPVSASRGRSPSRRGSARRPRPARRGLPRRSVRARSAARARAARRTRDRRGSTPRRRAPPPTRARRSLTRPTRRRRPRAPRGRPRAPPRATRRSSPDSSRPRRRAPGARVRPGAGGGGSGATPQKARARRGSSGPATRVPASRGGRAGHLGRGVPQVAEPPGDLHLEREAVGPRDDADADPADVAGERAAPVAPGAGGARRRPLLVEERRGRTRPRAVSPASTTSTSAAGTAPATPPRPPDAPPRATPSRPPR